MTTLNSLVVNNTKVTHTGDTTETVLATYTLPANTLPANGQLEIGVRASRSGTNSAITYKVRFGGISGTAYAGNLTLITNANETAQGKVIIAANNSTSVQKGFGAGISGNNGVITPFTANPTAFITSAIDTTSDVDIVITAQLGNAADTAALEGYDIILKA